MAKNSPYLKVSGWEKWQSYRRDRGQPPWIKIHRRIMRNPEWVSMNDAQRGQLVAIWLLAADHDGKIPDDPITIQKLCFMAKKPDLELFISLEFIDKRRQRGVNVASSGGQGDNPDKNRIETDKNRIEEEADSVVATILPKGVGNVAFYLVKESKVKQYEMTYPSIDVRQEIRTMVQWTEDNPEKRKTTRGIPRFINAWLARAMKDKTNGTSHKTMTAPQLGGENRGQIVTAEELKAAKARTAKAMDAMRHAKEKRKGGK